MQLRQVTAAEPALLPGLCRLLIDSVRGGASVGFLAPLAESTALRYWQGVYAALGEGLLLWVVEEEGKVVGSVQLAPCGKENGRHRGEIQKLFVHSDCRGRGLSRQLMDAAESEARARGLTLLVLDTLAGSAAASIYPRLGWQRAGEIPHYAALPDGDIRPTVIFYKRLAA
ncbi:MAG: GNAT family N-acetyltransferase [Betaproteobacteria bacterium]|jgi:acetyltransferase